MQENEKHYFIDILENKIQEQVKAGLKLQHKKINSVELQALRPIPESLRKKNNLYSEEEKGCDKNKEIDFTYDNIKNNQPFSIGIVKPFWTDEERRFCQEFFQTLLPKYKPVYCCTCELKSGESKVYYVKPIFGSDFNFHAAEALIHMGSIGYHIPNSVELLYEQQITTNIAGMKIQSSVLITEDAKSFMSEGYLDKSVEKEGGGIFMTEYEVIDLLLLQFKYGLTDNKTLKTTHLKTANGKNKNVFFDPSLNHYLDLSNTFHCITSYFTQVLANDDEKQNSTPEELELWYRDAVHQTKLKDIFSKNQGKEYFETHAFKLFVEFLIQEKAINESERDKVNLRMIKDKGKENLIFDFTNNPRYFIKEDCQKKLLEFLEGRKNKNNSAKKQYFWSRNKHLHEKFDKIPYLKEGVTQPKKQILLKPLFDSSTQEGDLRGRVPDTHKLIEDDLSVANQETYEPKLLSSLDTQSFAKNVAGYQSRHLFNLKNLDQIKYSKITNEEGKETGCKITPLYKEKRQNLDDSWISSDISDKKEVQKHIVDTLVELANIHNISLQHLSCIIVASIKQDGYSSIKDNQDIAGKKLSAEFQKQMQSKNIYTGRITNLGDAKVGLRLKRLPKAIIELLKDRVSEFSTASENDRFKIPDGLKNRDKFIIQRTI